MSTNQTYSVDIHTGVKIPTRDGVLLNATVYRPQTSARVPAVFTLTPYIADSYHDRAYYFARHGLAYALVDWRGRGSSGGDFIMPTFDSADGTDIVNWLAAQPWCDGQVAMWGGSAAGVNQLQTLRHFPPGLATIAPAAAGSPRLISAFDGPMRLNHMLRYLVLVSGKTVNWNLFFQTDYWIEKYRAFYKQHLPYTQLDSFLLFPSEHFQELLSLSPSDLAPRAGVWTPEKFQRINIPILSLCGQYDEMSGAQLTWRSQHERWGTPKAVANHYVVIGPWDHAGTRTPMRDIGGWRFGEAALVDMNQLHLDWYRWTMQGGPKPAFLKNNIVYYVTGLEQWRYADSLASVANQTQRLYLTSTAGQANDVFHAGRLTAEAPTQAEPDRFVYDPLDTRPGELETEEVKAYITDERYALRLMGNGVIYHSAPFAQDTIIAGRVKLKVWLSLDTPDTDFEVTLAEIQPDGTHMRLTTDQLRARYRDGLDEEKLVPEGEIIPYVFEHFNFFARRIRKGSRLRLTLKCPNSIWRQKNYNSARRVEEQSGADARTAHITVYHDAEHPSYLDLPIL